MDFFEKLAELEHQQWQAWAEEILNTEPNLSAKRKERWGMLLLFQYQSLTENQKEKDRAWARKAVAIFAELIEEIYNKYKIPDGDLRFTLDGIDLKTIVNHPISAMRAELLEKLKAKI